MGGSRGGGGGAGSPDRPPGKTQVAIRFLKNSGTDPLEKQLSTIEPRVKLLIEKGPYGSL